MAQPSNTQQAAQAALAGLAVQDVEGALSHIPDLTDQRLVILLNALTSKYGKVSGALAGRFYQAQRRAAGLGAHSASVAPVPPREAVAKMVGWATHDKTGKLLDLGAARPRIEVGTAKLVQDTGRLTVIHSVHADPDARGWARATEDDPCYFCALLASRGGVYTKASASFKSHDNCECYPIPEFAAQTPEVRAALARGRTWDSEYAVAQKNRKDGQSLLNAWRAHYDANVRPAAQAAAA